MKKAISLTLFLTITAILYAQDSDLATKAYASAIKDGPSTAPDIVVVKINNLNTGISKEVCTDVASLFWAIQQENDENDYKKETEYLLSKSADRTFDLKKPEALKRLNFNNYKFSKAKTIKSIIIGNHLTDSLKKLVRFNEILRTEYESYDDRRDDILEQIGDSIKKVRQLTNEEEKMIKDLNDRYYDDYYTNPIYNKYRTISPNGRLFMKIWSEKIKIYKRKISKSEAESKRMYNKFFQQYYKAYGISFCHMAFKYGIITYFGDENPAVAFSGVI